MLRKAGAPRNGKRGFWGRQRGKEETFGSGKARQDTLTVIPVQVMGPGSLSWVEAVLFYTFYPNSLSKLCPPAQYSFPEALDGDLD